MTIPDWTEAPEGATHYDVIADLFCTVDYFWSKGKRIGCNGGHFNWNTDRYTPRPVAQTDRTQLLTALNQLRGETDMGIVADVILSIGFKLER